MSSGSKARVWVLVRTLTAGREKLEEVKPRGGWDNEESSGSSRIGDTSFSIAPEENEP